MVGHGRRSDKPAAWPDHDVNPGCGMERDPIFALKGHWHTKDHYSQPTVGCQRLHVAGLTGAVTASPGSFSTAGRSLTFRTWEVSRPSAAAVSAGPLSLRSTAATRSPREMSPSTTSRPIPLPPP